MKRLAIISCLTLAGGSTLLYFVNQRFQIIKPYEAKASPDAGLTKGTAGECQLGPLDYRNGKKRFAEVKSRVTPHLEKALKEKGFALGSKVFLRSFKEEKELELWMPKSNKQKFELAHTWKISGLSGDLGPKQKEGDRQSPEGFYEVSLPLFNPQSTFHLSFNIGYPNSYDRSHQRTGSSIMVHGNTGSVGCLAMTDSYIEEIYTICHAAISSSK